MSRDRFGCRVPMIAALEATDDSARRVRLRHVQYLLGQGRKIRGFQPQSSDGIESMRIESRTDKDQLRFALRGCPFECAGERRMIISEPSAVTDRHVERRAAA